MNILPVTTDLILCPVRALKAVLQSLPLSTHLPLFANKFYTYSQVFDSPSGSGEVE